MRPGMMCMWYNNELKLKMILKKIDSSRKIKKKHQKIKDT
jgi:hypothetical protein